MQNRIFCTDSAKAIKADKFGWLNAICYMAPADDAGVGNLCPFAGACKALCLGKYAGHAGIVKGGDIENGTNNVRESRRNKARRFMRDRHNFMRDMVRSINNLIRRAARLGKQLAVRPNGSTDIAWESIRDAKGRTIFDLFPFLPFLDYTKNWRRFDRSLPANYHLTFSRDETNEAKALELLGRGFNVAVVFETIPLSWKGHIVINGDQHDLRHLDPRAEPGCPGYVIGLVPKGSKAKKDSSGFVVR